MRIRPSKLIEAQAHQSRPGGIIIGELEGSILVLASPSETIGRHVICSRSQAATDGRGAQREVATGRGRSELTTGDV